MGGTQTLTRISYTVRNKRYIRYLLASTTEQNTFRFLFIFCGLHIFGLNNALAWKKA